MKSSNLIKISLCSLSLDLTHPEFHLATKLTLFTITNPSLELTGRVPGFSPLQYSLALSLKLHVLESLVWAHSEDMAVA